MPDKEYDIVEKPAHYADTDIQPIEYIEDKNLGYCLGSAVKYISRAGKKEDPSLSKEEKAIEDLKKAIWFIERRILEIKHNLCD